MATEYQLSMNDYLLIAKRRAVLMTATFLTILAVALVVTVAVPPVYQSTGTIIIESQKIPTDLVPAMVTSFVEERIEVIRQRVITRENLEKIIEKYGLYKDSDRSMNLSEKLDHMRKNIIVERISADVKGSRKGAQSTIAFKITFEHRRADFAYRVASELVTLFLNENVKLRTERASDTTDFLTKESEKLKANLSEIESQLATYKQENAAALPEHAQLRMASMQRAESELSNVEREYKTTQEELRLLEVQLASAKAGIGVSTPSVKPNQMLSPEQELAQLRVEYERLIATYTPIHPDVRYVKSKIERLEKSVGSNQKQGSASAVATASDFAVLQVQSKIDSGNQRLSSLAQQQKSLRTKISQLEAQTMQSPQVERGMTMLMRDYENAQKKYEEVRAKQMNAQISENLEEGNNGERFSLIDPPLMPETPAKPNRPKILLIGIAMAFAGAGGLVFALETLNQRVRGADQLTAIIRQRPIAVIPYITISEEIDKKEIWRKRFLKAGLISIPIILLLVNFLYMRLDILVFKILARFG